MARPQALVLADVPSPHQNVFFDAIADLGEVDLEVFFCRPTMPGRAWSGIGPARARHRFLPELTVRAIPANPTLIPELLLRPNWLPFVNGYYLPGLLGAGLLLGALGRPWVFWMDALESLGSGGPWLKRTLARAARDWYLAKATSFLSTGNRGRRLLLDANVPPARVFEIPFVVDAQAIQAAVAAAAPDRPRLRQALGVPEGSRLMLFVGQAIARKGIDLLIEALAQTPPELRKRIHILCIGEGADRAAFERQALAAGVDQQLHWLPNLDISKLPPYWAAADALVLPSRYDAWGVVVDEALTAGLPVLGSDACGAVVDRVLPGVNGWIFPSGDVPALAAHLAQIAGAPLESLVALGKAGQATMASFAPRAMARKFTAVVQATLDRKPGSI